ncbi:MAG: DUF3800 domain-containing protein [Candidatus Marinimicrobia bacterium CG08_land_8_20_14_0_20_45_22]|nr:MAG: DUF3800 domain-containing protein [Candidatus Marinimicrobia bacterium CG08_land_8_20_14_0_20_45_22]
MQRFSIYCDESCHLENDHINVMVLGAVWCPAARKDEIFKEIRAIKEKHGLSKRFEIKWTKISDSKVDFYVELIDYFFLKNELHFRGLVILNKSQLNHEKFDQDHDKWYYKMYFELLKGIINQRNKYRIYLDYKDTRGGQRIEKLHEVLCNDQYDFSRDIITRIQPVRSHEVEVLQLTDLLIGALSYYHRGLSTNQGKIKVIQRIIEQSGFALSKSTLPSEGKFNLFIWRPRPCV